MQFLIREGPQRGTHGVDVAQVSPQQQPFELGTSTRGLEGQSSCQRALGLLP